eukprot:7074983-Alexandrium_andersonii.AAC.1
MVGRPLAERAEARAASREKAKQRLAVAPPPPIMPGQGSSSRDAESACGPPASGALPPDQQ